MRQKAPEITPFDPLLLQQALCHLPTPFLRALVKDIIAELKRRNLEAFVGRRIGKSSQFRAKDYPYDEALVRLQAHNSSALLSIPQRIRDLSPASRIRYLPAVIAQDWGSLFPVAIESEARYYVYAHVDIRENILTLEPFNLVCPGLPFYIGKGSGNRAWDLKRNQGHGKRIKQLRDAGFPDKSMVLIIANNMTEREALILEAKLIYFFGSIYDATVDGCLLNLADHIKPKFVASMQKIPGRKLCFTPDQPIHENP